MKRQPQGKRSIFPTRKESKSADNCTVFHNVHFFSTLPKVAGVVFFVLSLTSLSYLSTRRVNAVEIEPVLVGSNLRIGPGINVVPELKKEEEDWGKYLPSAMSKNDWCPSAGSAGQAFVQSMFSKAMSDRDSACVSIDRVGDAGDGGKILCTEDIKKNDCVVFSLGSRLDFSFEVDMVRRFGCIVHTFDCTVGTPSATKVPKGVFFHPWCIGGKDEVKMISSDLGHSKELGQYYTLSTIREKLEVSSIDLLKMDIERHEFSAISSMINAADAPKQISFEAHLHKAYGMWGRPVSYQEWKSMWSSLDMLGYSVFSYEPNPIALCCCEFTLH